MPMTYLIPAGMSLLGGLLGSEEKTVGKVDPTSRTTVSNSSHGSSTQNYIDPRMEQAIYGAGGIMPNATAWYMKNQPGLNDKMVTGMNNQWNQLGASTQGFNQMQNLGMGLMSGGTAGNPFTGGGGIAPQQMSYKPADFSGGGSTNPFAMPTAQTPAAAMPAGAAGGGGGGGDAGYSPMSDALSQTVAAMGANGGGAGGAGNWMYDESGTRFWQPTSGGYSYGSPSGGHIPSSYNFGGSDSSGYDGSWSGGDNGSGDA